MNFHLKNKSLDICVDHRTHSLDHPKLEVMEGWLNGDSCEEVRMESGEWISSVYFRWNIQNRIFLGDATVQRMGSGFCWQMRVRPEDGLEWKLLHTTEGSGELLGWADTSEV